jgi:hypothetical protein
MHKDYPDLWLQNLALTLNFVDLLRTQGNFNLATQFNNNNNITY